MASWTHKVVKSQRGMDGKWFVQSSKTFAGEQAAREFAERFAAEQQAAGVVGTRINVLSRKSFAGEFGPTNNVAEYRVGA